MGPPSPLYQIVVSHDNFWIPTHFPQACSFPPSGFGLSLRHGELHPRVLPLTSVIRTLRSAFLFFHFSPSYRPNFCFLLADPTDPPGRCGTSSCSSSLSLVTPRPRFFMRILFPSKEGTAVPAPQVYRKDKSSPNVCRSRPDQKNRPFSLLLLPLECISPVGELVADAWPRPARRSTYPVVPSLPFLP